MQVRSVVASDLMALVELENRCFTGDKLSERSFRRFIKQEHCRLMVAQAQQGQILGYALMLMRLGTSLVRVYSLAVAPECQGQGIGQQLLASLEQVAEDEQFRFIRLEVHINNQAAIRLYQRTGYRKLGERKGYYEDGGTAILMEKRLRSAYQRPKNLAYYPQSTPFTCGPAALMMAMHQLEPKLAMSREHELQLWREATTIYMTTGLGGSSPFGLALAAGRRGFHAQVWTSHLLPPFVEGVRSKAKQELMQVVHYDFLQQCQQAGIELKEQELSKELMIELKQQGFEILLLISTWRLNRNKAPHWVWLAGIDQYHAFLNDPDIDEDYDQSAFDNQFMPVSIDELQTMTRYGKGRYRAAVLLRRTGP